MYLSVALPIRCRIWWPNRWSGRSSVASIMKFWVYWESYFWLVVWNIFFFPYIGNNHPNWLIFFRGVETTNQILCCKKLRPALFPTLCMSDRGPSNYFRPRRRQLWLCCFQRSLYILYLGRSPISKQAYHHCFPWFRVPISQVKGIKIRMCFL